MLRWTQQTQSLTKFEILAAIALKLSLLYLSTKMAIKMTAYIVAYAFIIINAIRKTFLVDKNKISRINGDSFFSIEQCLLFIVCIIKVIMLYEFRNRESMDDQFRTFYEITKEYSIMNAALLILPQLVIMLNLLLCAMISRRTFNKTLIDYNLNSPPNRRSRIYVYLGEMSVVIVGVFCPLYFRNIFALFISAFYIFILMRGKMVRLSLLSYIFLIAFVFLVKINKIADTMFIFHRCFIDASANQPEFILFIFVLHIIHTLTIAVKKFIRNKNTLIKEAKLNSTYFDELKFQSTFFHSYFIPNFTNISNANHLKISNNMVLNYLGKFGIEITKQQSQISNAIRSTNVGNQHWYSKLCLYLYSGLNKAYTGIKFISAYLQSELVYLMIIWHYTIYFRQNPLTVIVLFYIGISYSRKLTVKTQNVLITIMIIFLWIDIVLLLMVNLDNMLVTDGVLRKIFGRHHFVKFFLFKICMILLGVLKFSNLIVQKGNKFSEKTKSFNFKLYNIFVVLANHIMILSAFLIQIEIQKEFAAIFYSTVIIMYIWTYPPRFILMILSIVINGSLIILFLDEILEGLDNTTEVVFNICKNYYLIIITYVSLNVHSKYIQSRESRCDFVWFNSDTTSISRRFLLYIVPLIGVVAAVSMIYAYDYFPQDLLYFELGYYLLNFYIVIEILRIRTHRIMTTINRVIMPIFLLLCTDMTLFILRYELFYLKPLRRVSFVVLLMVFINLVRIVYTNIKNEKCLEKLNGYKLRINSIQQTDNFIDQPLLNRKETILSRNVSFLDTDLIKSNSFIKLKGNSRRKKDRKTSANDRENYYKEIRSDDDEVDVKFINDLNIRTSILPTVTRIGPTQLLLKRDTNNLNNEEYSEFDDFESVKSIRNANPRPELPIHWDHENNDSKNFVNLPESYSITKKKVGELLERYYKLKFEYKRVCGLKNLRNMILQSYKIRLALKNMDFAVVFTILNLAIFYKVSLFNLIYLALMLNYLRNIYYHYNNAAYKYKIDLYHKMIFERIIERNRIEKKDFVQCFLKDKARFLTVLYEFYKQAELQRLLVFNIVISVLNLIFLRGYLAYIDFIGEEHVDASLKLILQIVGAENRETFPVITLFLFFNLLCLMLNKIFLSAIKDVHLFELKRINSAKKSLEIEDSVIEENYMGNSNFNKTVKDDTYHNVDKHMETEFDITQKLMRYKNMNNYDVIFANLFRFVIEYVNYIIITLIMFINFTNKNIIGIVILLYLLFKKIPNHKNVGSWVCSLIVFKLLVIYFILLLYVESNDDSNKSLINFITKNRIIRFLLENILIGKEFRLQYYFIESLLLVFFIIDQKIKIAFNKYMIRFVETHQKIDKSKKTIEITGLVFFIRKTATFLLVNSTTVYLLMTVMMSYFFGNSLSIGLMNTVAFIFAYLTDFRENRVQKEKMSFVITNLKIIKKITIMALIIQQSVFILLENLEVDYTNYLRTADFIFFLICFCLINGFLTILDTCCIKSLIDGYLYDRTIKEFTSIKMRANELHGLKVEAKYRQLINENAKERRLNKVFSLLGNVERDQSFLNIVKDKFSSTKNEHTHELKSSIPVQGIHKYNYLYFFYQCEYIITKYQIKTNSSDCKKFVIDYFDGRLLENELFKKITQTIDKNYLYINQWDFNKYTSKNIFRIETDRWLLNNKSWVLRKLTSFFSLHLDQLLKMLILSMYVVQSGLLYKLLVLYCLVYDFLYIVPLDNTRKLMFILIPLTVIKHLLSNVYLKHIYDTSGHALSFNIFYYLYMLIGDLSPSTDLIIIFWLCIVFLLGKFKMNHTMHKIYYSINFSKIFIALSFSEFFMYSIIREIKQVRFTATTKLDRVRFKVFSILEFIRVRRRIRNFIYSNYLWEKIHQIDPYNHLQSVFHPLLFKFGKNLTSYIIIIHFVIVFYIFVFYNLMFDKGALIVDSIKTSEINGEMVLFIIFWCSCIIIDTLLLYKQSAKWRTLQNFRLSRGDYFRSIFKKNVYKVININRLETKEFDIAKRYDHAELNNIKTQQSKKNPLYYKYLFTMALFILTSLYIIYRGLQKAAMYKNNNEMTTDDFLKRLALADNSYISFFSLLILGYTILSLLLIRIGSQPESYYTSTQFPLWKEYIYKALNLIPFVRELRIFLSWTSSKTSLNWSDWFIIDYAYFQCIHLFDVCYKKKQDFVEIPRYKKTFIGFMPSISLLLLILGPLLLFSNFNPISKPNVFNSYSVTFSLGIEGLSNFKIYTANNLMNISEVTSTEYSYFYPYVEMLNEITIDRVRVS